MNKPILILKNLVSTSNRLSICSLLIRNNSSAVEMTKKALVFLAEGAEEMETVITVDTLRRAGIEVTLAGVAGDQTVLCSRNVKIVPDCSLESASHHDYDAVIIPGGLKGAETCSTDHKVGELLKKHYDHNKLVAAICAGPTALLSHKIGYGKKVTAYPSVKDKLTPHYDYHADRVVQDGNLITSQGPGTTFEFALKIVEYLLGHEKSAALIDPMRLKL